MVPVLCEPEACLEPVQVALAGVAEAVQEVVLVVLQVIIAL